jgi:hypothetical protein
MVFGQYLAINRGWKKCSFGYLLSVVYTTKRGDELIYSFTEYDNSSVFLVALLMKQLYW